MKVSFQNILIYFFINLFSFLFAISVSSSENRKTSYSVIETHTQLLRQIDSLDLEKQNKKRTGKDIDEIEQQQRILVDSLKKTRILLESKNFFHEKETTPFSSFFNPSSLFDWIILVTSIIALVSLIIFIFSFLSTATKRMHKKQNTKKITINKKHPAKNEAKEHTYSLNEELELLEQLRRKIKIDNNATTSTSIKPPTRICNTLPVQIQNESTSDTNTSDLQKEIIEAFQNGSEVPDLSRKFHLSTDHISLILKMNEAALKK